MTDNRYFRVADDLHIAKRWFLGSPMDSRGREVEPWQFINGKKTKAGESLVVPISTHGKELTFTFGEFDLPLIREELGRVISKIAPDDIQLIPVAIEGHSGRFEILNAISCVRCLDRSMARFTRWTADDGWPEKTGSIRTMEHLVLNRKAISNHKVFRVYEWEVALIVHEQIRAALGERGATGVLFEEVECSSE